MRFALAAAAVHLVLLPHGPGGLRGTATLTSVSPTATRITMALNVHDRRLRPVHIHGGRCGNFFGLPFGAFAIRGPRASFLVRAPLKTLTSGGYAIDVHAAVASPRWITCANL